MKRAYVVKVLMAVKSSPFGNVTQGLNPSAVEYCVNAGLVRGIPVTHLTSPHPEYILQGITVAGEDYLENNRLLRRLLGVFEKWWIPIVGFVASIVTIVGFALHWWGGR
jgi:hypothetical protein